MRGGTGEGKEKEGQQGRCQRGTARCAGGYEMLAIRDLLIGIVPGLDTEGLTDRFLFKAFSKVEILPYMREGPNAASSRKNFLGKKKQNFPEKKGEEVPICHDEHPASSFRRGKRTRAENQQ